MTMKGKDRKKMGLHAKPLSFFFFFPVAFVLGGLSACTEPPPQNAGELLTCMPRTHAHVVCDDCVLPHVCALY